VQHKATSPQTRFKTHYSRENPYENSSKPSTNVGGVGLLIGVRYMTNEGYVMIKMKTEQMVSLGSSMSARARGDWLASHACLQASNDVAYKLTA
jgi:hypothetical protein